MRGQLYDAAALDLRGPHPFLPYAESSLDSLAIAPKSSTHAFHPSVKYPRNPCEVGIVLPPCTLHTMLISGTGTRWLPLSNRRSLMSVSSVLRMAELAWGGHVEMHASGVGQGAV